MGWIAGPFGEDIDFPNGGTVSVSTATNQRRTGYSRCSVYSGSGGVFIKSPTFSSPVTSCWWTSQIFYNNGGTNLILGGLGKSGTDSGLFLGTAAAAYPAKAALLKRDAGSVTQLAVESGTSLTYNAVVRIDFQIVSYGATATVNIYINGSLVITYTGNVGATGVSNLDQFWIMGTGGGTALFSEIYIDSADTRPIIGIRTRAATGNGTNWSNNAATNINPTSINDANSTYTNTSGQDNQYSIDSELAGINRVALRRIAVRAWATSDSTPTKLALGFKSGSSVGVGSAHSLGTTAALYEDIFTTSPITGNPWLDTSQSEATGLMLDLESVA